MIPVWLFTIFKNVNSNKLPKNLTKKAYVTEETFSGKIDFHFQKTK